MLNINHSVCDRVHVCVCGGGVGLVRPGAGALGVVLHACPLVCRVTR